MKRVQTEPVVYIWTLFWVTNIDQTNFVKKRVIWLSSYSPSCKKAKTGTQARNLDAETEAEAMEEHCYWLLPMACSACLTIQSRTTF